MLTMGLAPCRTTEDGLWRHETHVIPHSEPLSFASRRTLELRAHDDD